MKTKEQLSQDLLVVEDAITRLIQGKSLRKFTIGSGDFMRTYEYNDITYEMLRKLKLSIQEELANLEDSTTFRTSSIPLVVTKYC